MVTLTPLQKEKKENPEETKLIFGSSYLENA